MEINKRTTQRKKKKEYSHILKKKTRMFIKKGLWGRVHGHGPKQGCRGGVGLGYMGAGGAGAGDGGIATHHAQIASQWPD